MVLKTNTGWLVPEMCSDASKLLALIGKKNVGAVFCFVYFHFFFPSSYFYIFACRTRFIKNYTNKLHKIK